MKKILQKLTKLFHNPKPQPTKHGGTFRGQSLVEFAIAFPVVIMLFAGVIEFGFILNYYLSLLDATREAARFYSNQDPFAADPNTARNASDWFYADAAAMVKDALEPRSANDTTRKIVLDSSQDDVIITVFSLCPTKAVSFPTGGYHMYNNDTSVFTNASMLSARLSGAPNEGALLVEVHYNYHQVLALPWITPFLSNPLPLRAYSIMPLNAAEPPLVAPKPVVTCP